MCICTLAWRPGGTAGQRELLFELGGGLLQNVFLIFSFPSASVDRTSLCTASNWSQRQQAKHSVKFSSFCPSSPLFHLSPTMHWFYYRPQFPSCKNCFYSLPSFFFLFIFKLLLFPWFLPWFGLSLHFLSASFPLCSPMVL